MQPASSRNWIILSERNPIPPEVSAAMDRYPPFLRTLLYNRGVRTGAEAQAFLECSDIPVDLGSMLGLYRAVERILAAIEAGEPIAVYGDFDVDGVTATVLLVEVLRAIESHRYPGMPTRIRPYIPNRFEEGYGLNRQALAELAGKGFKLVVTVDCGIRSPAKAEYARSLGLEMVITDHHHCGGDLPQCAAVINPKQPGDRYAYKDLSGVGLAYRLAEGLLQRAPVPNVSAEHWLDLVALGTVADMVPLIGENRVLVRRGLSRMRRMGRGEIAQRAGLVSLAAVAGVRLERINATDIAFALAPRLNAAGRIDTATLAYCLLTGRGDVARHAQELDDRNRTRQAEMRQMQERVAGKLQAAADTPLIFDYDTQFNQGIVGLTAQRLVEQFYRPAIVGYFDTEKQTVRASCRSIPGFHITEALDSCADLLVRHGGHAVAAGFTVTLEQLPALQARLTELAQEQLGDLAVLVRQMEADMVIPLAQLAGNAPTVFQLIEYLQPTGMANRDPLFVSRGLDVRYSGTVGKEKQHLKLVVSDARSGGVSALYWRNGHLAQVVRPGMRIDLMYRFEPHDYNGMRSVQLNVVDWKPSEP